MALLRQIPLPRADGHVLTSELSYPHYFSRVNAQESHLTSRIDTTTTTMPSAINPAPWVRTCTLRPRRANVLLRPVIGVKRPAGWRNYADDTNRPDKLPEAPVGQKGPNTQQQEHVTEEAAKMAKIQGKEGPDVEQGTPVQEVSDSKMERVMRINANN